MLASVMHETMILCKIPVLQTQSLEGRHPAKRFGQRRAGTLTAVARVQASHVAAQAQRVQVWQPAVACQGTDKRLAPLLPVCLVHVEGLEQVQRGNSLTMQFGEPIRKGWEAEVLQSTFSKVSALAHLHSLNSGFIS